MDTPAEALLNLLPPKGCGLIVCEGANGVFVSQFALADKLSKRPEIVLRAIVEEWTVPQIVKELH